MEFNSIVKALQKEGFVMKIKNFCDKYCDVDPSEAWQYAHYCCSNDWSLCENDDECYITLKKENIKLKFLNKFNEDKNKTIFYFKSDYYPGKRFNDINPIKRINCSDIAALFFPKEHPDKIGIRLSNGERFLTNGKVKFDNN
jgi:hypothetical protein